MPRRVIPIGGGPTTFDFQDQADPLANGIGYAIGQWLRTGRDRAEIEMKEADRTHTQGLEDRRMDLSEQEAADQHAGFQHRVDQDKQLMDLRRTQAATASEIARARAAKGAGATGSAKDRAFDPYIVEEYPNPDNQFGPPLHKRRLKTEQEIRDELHARDAAHPSIGSGIAEWLKGMVGSGAPAQAPAAPVTAPPAAASAAPAAPADQASLGLIDSMSADPAPAPRAPAPPDSATQPYYPPAVPAGAPGRIFNPVTGAWQAEDPKAASNADFYAKEAMDRHASGGAAGLKAYMVWLKGEDPKAYAATMARLRAADAGQ